MLSVAVAEWSPEYGDPHQADLEEAAGNAALVEETEFVPLAVQPASLPFSFVDGTRQIEGLLYLSDGERTWPGLAGVVAVGAVVPSSSGLRASPECSVDRVLVANQVPRGELPPQPGGWTWRWVDTAETEPQGCSQELQRWMREQEAQLAARLKGPVVLDGPLHGAALQCTRVVGYVKTQHRSVLSEELHARVPSLRAGQRSPLFAWAGRYGCYLRLADPVNAGHPWFSIVRLEASQTLRFEEARAFLAAAAGTLMRYSGVAHIDPRAPQNLQAIAGLEKELRRRCGDRALAWRALRSAIWK